MGTSKGYGGAPSGLVPSWADDTASGAAASPAPAGNDGDEQDGQPPRPARIPRALPDTSSSGSLTAAKANFTRFVRNRDEGTLRRAVSQYVRNGTGNAGKASRRMAASRGVGSRLLGVMRDIQRDGAAETLRRLNRLDLVGRPAADVFLILTEVICPPGGRVDEAIARQALLDTIADLAETEIGNFDEMTADQMSEFFLGYIIHTIEGRVLADIGKHAIDLPQDVAEVEYIQDQLHGFVEGCVRGHLEPSLVGLEQRTDQQVAAIVETIYEAAFELVSATAGDVE